jgi:murein DD-endopeptidase MepM/ murein hydrolase activator NlpD
MDRRLLWIACSSVLALSLSAAMGNTAQPKRLAANTQAVVDWRQGSFPVENFQEYTSAFGYRRSVTGGRGVEFHSGLDFAAPEGSYIRNWWTGRVSVVSDNTACGTSVHVQSGPWVHIYCHMSGYVGRDNRGRYMVDNRAGIRIWEGQIIPAGARIGRVGMTGRTTGPHLHWTLRYQGQLVNPAIVLRAMYAAQGISDPISVTGKSQE